MKTGDVLMGRSIQPRAGEKIPSPSSPEGFHGNPVSVGFGRDTWLFLEDLKATKNAFHFYSKADMLSLMMNSLTHACVHACMHTHTHT